MLVNAILFCHFVNLNTLFLTVLCRLYVCFVSVHAHVIFSYTFTQFFWFLNVAHAFVAFLYFLFSFLFKLLDLPVLSHFMLIFQISETILYL